MSAVEAAVDEIVRVTVPEPAPRGTPRRRAPGWRWVVLLVAAVFFATPVLASLEFSLRAGHGRYSFSSYAHIVSAPGFGSSFGLSLKLALLTVLITLALLVPTAVHVELRLPHLRRVLESVTILPVVIPPVVLVIGVLQVASALFPDALSSPYVLAFEYVILALPFAYRSLDAGLRAVDLKTLVEAARSLGGDRPTEMFRVILPNLRTAVFSATFLTVALVLGEFTIANLMLYPTFPVWIVTVGQTDAGVSVAVSLLALAVTWAILMVLSSLDRAPGGRRARRTRPGGARA